MSRRRTIAVAGLIAGAAAVGTYALRRRRRASAEPRTQFEAPAEIVSLEGRQARTVTPTVADTPKMAVPA